MKTKYKTFWLKYRTFWLAVSALALLIACAPVREEPVKKVMVIVDLELDLGLHEALEQGQTLFARILRKAIAEVRVLRRYDHVFGGLALELSERSVELLERLPGVRAVWPEEILQISMDRSASFIGATSKMNKDLDGTGIVIGIIDTGIWLEHPSFAGPRKILTAVSFVDEPVRDTEGHGTHVASIAAGNAGVPADIFDIPRGTISGIAPSARLAIYKACTQRGCSNINLLAAIDQAVADGVDIINFSIEGGRTPANPISQAFLDAYEAGVFVAAAAGNGGPSSGLTEHVVPWVTTVGASTHDRCFEGILQLAGFSALTGGSLTRALSRRPLISAAPFEDPRNLCLRPFAPGTFQDQIVVCTRGGNWRVEKSHNVAAGGAGGFILVNSELESVDADNHEIPAIHLDHVAGAELLNRLAPGLTASLSQGRSASCPGDRLATFSAYGGPHPGSLVIKPDVVAPGLQILGAHTPQPASARGGHAGEYFQAIHGTSMASPMVAGAAALLAQAHPGWGPGQIKSALMTTARQKVLLHSGARATPFQRGSGRINLRKARNPGITFSEPNYRALQASRQWWKANLASVWLPEAQGVTRVTRSARNETDKTLTFELRVQAPQALPIQAPSRLVLGARRETAFDIIVDASRLAKGQTAYATLTLKTDKYVAKMPIAIKKARR